MNQVRTHDRRAASDRPAIRYHPCEATRELLAQADTLAVLEFGGDRLAEDDPRRLSVPLDAGRPGTVLPVEHWWVNAAVEAGRKGALQWSAGGGWLFAALDLDESAFGGPGAAAEYAYAELCAFLAEHPQYHVLRLWNYLGAINQGEGDRERYKQFCAGRLRGMGSYFADGFPAATAIGHRQSTRRLQLYCLAGNAPGTRIENPRQLSAWRYPRQYGPTPPSFARAMRLPFDASLAISGTASITGHHSRHAGDLDAQLHETLSNLKALLRSTGLPEEFGPDDPLKVYVRHAGHAARVEAFLAEHAPEAPRILLLGDICRSELLVEIDGWRFA